jgi:3-mercaptopyruvate sulfurtransferase SseA
MSRFTQRDRNRLLWIANDGTAFAPRVQFMMRIFGHDLVNLA